MQPLRLFVLLAAVVLAAASAAPAQSQQPPPPPAGPPAGGDDCVAACGHYLQCRGADDPGLLAQCTGQCQQSSPDPSLLAQYAVLDCATAIQIVEGGGSPGGQPAGGAPAGGACNTDCTGCVWDGSTCYQRAMAAMGTTIECVSCCCAKGSGAPRWD